MMKMKRLMCVAAACVLGVCGPGALSACDEGEEEFVYNGGEGSFYSLQEAYDNGWLTQSDLLSIAYYQNGGREYNEELMAEDYEPAPKTPETVEQTSTLGKAIRQTYWANGMTEDEKSVFTLDDVGFVYYGCYDGCYAVKMGLDGGAVSDVVHEECVAGVMIYYTNGRTITIWKENSADTDETSEILGSFYDLQEAYDNGWLTQNDISSIAQRFQEKMLDFSAEEQMVLAFGADTVSAMKKIEANNINQGSTAYYPEIEVTAEDLTIIGYYGTYDQCIALRMAVPCAYPDVLTEISIADVDFGFTGTFIRVWIAA